MWHKLITKYGLATHLALLASLPWALLPFLSERSLAITILWLSLLAGLWLLVEPSILAGEHLSSARARVRRDLIRCPLSWCFLVVVSFTAVSWLNGGVALHYDPEQAAWAVMRPAIDILPTSAGESGFLPFAVTIGAGVLTAGVLYGLGLSARISFGVVMGFLLGVAGLVAATFVCFDVAPFVDLALNGFLSRPPVAPTPFYGTVYGLGLMLSVIAGMQAEERKWSVSRLFFCVAVAGNMAGLLFFAPPLAASAYLVVIGFFLLFAIVRLSRVGSLGGVAYSLTMVVFGVALAVCLLLAVAPEAVTKAKVDGMNLVVAFPENYRDVSDVLTRISRSMWKESPWRGAGIGAFNLHALFLAEKSDWALLSPKVAAALNGYWTFLAEQGILGCVMLGGIVCLLAFVWVRNLVRSVIYLRTCDDADIFVFACVPMVWAAPITIPLVCAEAFCSPVFSSSVMSLAVVAVLALSAASFPRGPRPRVAASE